jgi:hypothetical protein
MVEMNKEDQELAEIFSGEERELHPDTVHITLGKGVSKKETTTQKAKDKPVEEQWQPSKEHNWMDNLKNCVQWVIGFGGLSFLLFYWEQAGLMAESIAVPSMCLCTALAGWGLGKNVRCKK